MSRIPNSRPQASRSVIEGYISAAGLNLAEEQIVLVGVRGYYLDTMGVPHQNDRNMYDDAMFLVTPREMRSYNCNVDPSKYRAGIASLVPGVYEVVKHRHKDKYAALQIVEDTVTRDRQSGSFTGRHGINFHYGGDNDTWSEGCQTFPQSQYWQFQGHIYELMDATGKRRVKYVLVDPARPNAGLHPFHNITDNEISQVIEDSPAASTNDPADLNSPPAPRNADEPATADPADAQPGEPQPANLQEGATGFVAEKFTAYIPQIDTARRWIKAAFSFSTLGTAGAVYLGLPIWIQATLAGLGLLTVAGAIVVFVKYHDRVFAFITAMNTLRADDTMHNPEISADTPTS